MLLSKTLNRPTIEYLEIHLSDSCNLKCNNCSHFCFLVDKLILTDINDFKKDLEELSKKIDIKTIRLMGGEPLLHPQINDFLYYTRYFFPKSIIKLVTNGLLIHTKNSDFWNCIRTNNIFIDLTYYPRYKNYLNEVKDIIKVNNLEDRLWVAIKEIFYDVFNEYGSSDIKKSYANCTRRKWPNLWNHKIYICPDCFRYYYNEKYNKNIELPPYVDIYKYSGEKIYKELTKYKPSKACRYCKEVPIPILWEKFEDKNK